MIRKYNLSESPSYCRYWGKATVGGDSQTAYHLLPYHCLDVAAVGDILLTRHPVLLRRLSQQMQMPEQQARAWLVFLLGIHDLGKFAETFQQIRPDLRQHFWPDESIKRNNYSIRHDSLGEMLWQQFLCEQLFDEQENEAVAEFASETMNFWLKVLSPAPSRAESGPANHSQNLMPPADRVRRSGI